MCAKEGACGSSGLSGSYQRGGGEVGMREAGSGGPVFAPQFAAIFFFFL